jgi:exonuclease VII large subunit
MVRPNSYGRRDAQELASEIARGIDDATESLRWCKKHLQERKTAETLRLAQLNVAYLALALDWQMEGEMEKAFSAIDRIWWQPQRDEGETLDTSPTGH